MFLYNAGEQARKLMLHNMRPESVGKLPSRSLRTSSLEYQIDAATHLRKILSILASTIIYVYMLDYVLMMALGATEDFSDKSLQVFPYKSWSIKVSSVLHNYDTFKLFRVLGKLFLCFYIVLNGWRCSLFVDFFRCFFPQAPARLQKKPKFIHQQRCGSESTHWPDFGVGCCPATLGAQSTNGHSKVAVRNIVPRETHCVLMLFLFLRSEWFGGDVEKR